MAEPLYELLAHSRGDRAAFPALEDQHTTNYLTRLSTLSLSDLTTTEPASLLYSSQSHTRNLQALSKRSRKAVISSSNELANLTTLLPKLRNYTDALRKELPALESAATTFAEKYDRSTENEVLDRRKRAALLSRNVERLSDILDLPSLLSSTVTAAQAASSGATAAVAPAAGSSTSYASALDIQAHIKRLKTLYPQSGLVGSINDQAEVEMQMLATILITSLESPSLKLATAMRTIGYLRRVAPELIDDDAEASKSGIFSVKSLAISANTINNDGALAYLFLVCRLRTLKSTLDALDPLRELADQEAIQRQRQRTAQTNGKGAKSTGSTSVTSGSQSERFLKRYIEIFREQSFGILSMYKSIFPAGLLTQEPTGHGAPGLGGDGGASTATNPLLPLPSPAATFSLELVQLLDTTLREYMPNVVDKAARESLLTQVLYCAGSLGRLGAEFGMMIALLDEDLRAQDKEEEKEKEAENREQKQEADQSTVGEAAAIRSGDVEPEWVSVMQKHRVQASRLEVLARGVGGGRKVSGDATAALSASSPPITAG